MTRRILIITYYWPPAGGAGVQRWLKFVKYLPEYGWEPVVYTAENGEFPVLDPALEKEIPAGVEVIRRKIFEPYQWYKKFIGQKPEEKINTGFLSPSEKPERKERIARWIRGNLFIPDARKFWIRPSVRYLSKYLKEHPVNLIISTGPPHSMHLIARGLKKKLHLPWIADFRDPWTQIDFYEDLLLTRSADRKHRRLEQAVVRESDRVLSVNKKMREDFDRITPHITEYIPNGFDEDDFDNIPGKKDEHFTITYAGSLTPSRNPESFWKAVGELVRENTTLARKLRIRIIGQADISARKSVEKNNLSGYVRWEGYMSHPELLKTESASSMLLLLINRTRGAEGIVTGKLFEYLMVGKPIICIGPENGEAAAIIRETDSGDIAGFDDISAIKRILIKWFSFYEKGNNFHPSEKIRQFSRKSLTGKLSGILTDLLKTQT